MEQECSPIEIREESFRISDSGMVTGEIWLETGDVAFPEQHWNDFVVVILTWWLDAFRLVTVSGVASVCRFMDGPYEFHLARSGDDELTVSCAEGRARKVVHVRHVNARALKMGLGRAARAALKFCDGQQVTNKDIELLRTELQRLEGV